MWNGKVVAWSLVLPVPGQAKPQVRVFATRAQLDAVATEHMRERLATAPDTATAREVRAALDAGKIDDAVRQFQNAGCTIDIDVHYLDYTTALDQLEA